MRKLPILMLGSCLALVPLSSAAQGNADPHWIRDSGQTFCRIYNAFPEPGERVTWDGPMCRYAEAANGEGELTWSKDGHWTIKEHGKLVDGKMEGEWSREFASGAAAEKVYWVNGSRMPEGFAPRKADAYAGSNAPADSGASTGGYRSAPSSNAGDAYMETLKRQNRENCARAAQGANITCNPQ